MRFNACAVQASAEALFGNLFKMCSWEWRITRYTDQVLQHLRHFVVEANKRNKRQGERVPLTI